MSLLELLVVLGIVSVLVGVAGTSLHSSLYDVDNAAQQIEGSLRLVRSQAIASNVHYRLRIDSATRYQIQRMWEPSSGVWAVDRTVSTVSLPPMTTFSNPVDTVVRFDTRGHLVEPVRLVTLEVRDARTADARGVSIWPTGQVLP